MKYKDVDDETLVLLTLAGEEPAYETLVIKYQKSVIAAATAVTHSYGLAEDAAQDAFVTAWMKLNLLKDPDKFCSWVCRIAENCARRMMYRLREYVQVEELAEFLPDNAADANPAQAFEQQEETEALHRSIDRLPERVRLIIRMYYMEGKPIGEIASKLGVTIGTVKSQLFEGRQKLRKDLDAMNEERNDTLTERVMKKVEELKKWQYKSEKTGFETVYRDVLREVEELPESVQKNSALADVLMRGWRWIPGEQNDELFERIKKVALESKNEEVMSFVVARESEKLWGDKQIEWLRDTAIPELEKNGFRSAIGDAWIQIANSCDNESSEYATEVLEACKKAKEYLPSDTVNAGICTAIPRALSVSKEYCANRLPSNRYFVEAYAFELRVENGNPMLWKDRVFYISGNLEAYDNTACYIFSNAAKCDGLFTVPGVKVGENYREKLYYTADNAEVNTPAGSFTGCHVWTFCENFRKFITYYKEGIGIVRQDSFVDGFRTTLLLSEYSVNGSGLLPLTPGNSWSYVIEKGNSSLFIESKCTVDCNSEGKILISGYMGASRGEYNENSWEDMAQALANEYIREENGDAVVLDMTHYINRAEALAVTPAQKAHTSAAASVMRRIMDGEIALHPDTHRTSLWNFFTREVIGRQDNRLISSSYNSRWSFEYKGQGRGFQMRVLTNNFIYNILEENAHALWNDDWCDGYTEEMTADDCGDCIKTRLVCAACGETVVPAGTFSDCLKITLDVSGHHSGLNYRNGTQEYTFAPGVGLISVSSGYPDVSTKSVYLLTKYSGTGEGYMPMGDGFFRRYEAQDLTDGYVAWTEYTVAKSDADDALLLFANQCGCLDEPQGISSYSVVTDEQKERKLYAEKHIGDGKAIGKINDLKIFLHLFFRSRNLRGSGAYGAAYHQMITDSMKVLGGGEVPDAFVGAYARSMLSYGAACMSADRFEDGFECIDKCLAAIRKWNTFKDGELLSVGSEVIYKDVYMVKGKPILVLPDGTREFIEVSSGQLSPDKTLPYYAMTHLKGWKWFEPAVNHPVYGVRFSEYIEKAKKLAEE